MKTIKEGEEEKKISRFRLGERDLPGG